MSTFQTIPNDAGRGVECSPENHALRRQRSLRLGRLLVIAIILIACTVTAARGALRDRKHGEPKTRTRIACMC